MNIYSCRCGLTWNGLRASHCTTCHATFNADRIGDAHQVGSFHPDERRCLSETEMFAKGWQHKPCLTGDPVWRGPEMSEEAKAAKFGAA